MKRNIDSFSKIDKFLTSVKDINGLTLNSLKECEEFDHGRKTARMNKIKSEPSFKFQNFSAHKIYFNEENSTAIIQFKDKFHLNQVFSDFKGVKSILAYKNKKGLIQADIKNQTNEFPSLQEEEISNKNEVMDLDNNFSVSYSLKRTHANFVINNSFLNLNRENPQIQNNFDQ